jgi:hypothetical protein
MLRKLLLNWNCKFVFSQLPINSCNVWFSIFYLFLITHNNRSNTNQFYIVHEDSGLYTCAKGHPTKELSLIRLECPKRVEDDLKSIREDFVLNNQSEMLFMVLLATYEMKRLVAMYPDVWFIDTTAGQSHIFSVFT